MKDGKPWVGDEVRDEVTGRKAIVTGVRRGSVYVLPHVWGGGDTWEAENPEKLTVTGPASGGRHQTEGREAARDRAQHWTPDQDGPSHMGRTEYYNDPNAPKANPLIPASNLLVVDG